MFHEITKSGPHQNLRCAWNNSSLLSHSITDTYAPVLTDWQTASPNGALKTVNGDGQGYNGRDQQLWRDLADLVISHSSDSILSHIHILPKQTHTFACWRWVTPSVTPPLPRAFVRLTTSVFGKRVLTITLCHVGDGSGIAAESCDSSGHTKKCVNRSEHVDKMSHCSDAWTGF